MINANDYEEVYEILSKMDKSIVMKIPIEVLNNILEKRNKNYISKIDKNDIFNLDNMSENTKNILAWIDVNYWIDEEKKNILKKKILLKNVEEEKLKKEKYDSDIFKNKKNIKNKLIAIKNEKTLFQNIIKNIKIFFCRKNKE